MVEGYIFNLFISFYTQFLNNVIIFKIKIHLPQAYATLAEFEYPV
jgi:hypothetical protein